MSNNSTLVAGGHKFTKQQQSKGGSKTTIATRLANRKKCEPKCPIYKTCPFMTISCAPESEYEGIKVGGNRCAVKVMPQKIQNRVMNLFVNGEDGIIKEMQADLFDISQAADKEGTTKAKSIKFDKKKDFKEAVYGRIVKQQVSGELKTGLEADKLREIMEEVHGKTKPPKETDKG